MRILRACVERMTANAPRSLNSLRSACRPFVHDKDCKSMFSITDSMRTPWYRWPDSQCHVRTFCVKNCDPGREVPSPPEVRRTLTLVSWFINGRLPAPTNRDTPRIFHSHRAHEPE